MLNVCCGLKIQYTAAVAVASMGALCNWGKQSKLKTHRSLNEVENQI